MLKETEINGIKFYYRPDTQDWNIIKESCGGIYTKFFDVEDFDEWFDIGANIGGFTCYAASKGATVIAYEPIPENFNLLSLNVELNEFNNYAHLYAAAIAKDFGKVKLFVDRNNFGNCSIYDRGLTETIIVPTIPAKLLNMYEEKCIKIDTEGCEYEILSELDLSKVNKIILEDHYWLETHEEHDQIINMLNCFPNNRSFGGYMYYAWR